MNLLFNKPAARAIALAALAVAGVLGGVSAQAQAIVPVGTASGTDINNIATLNYSVGTVAQPLIKSSPTGSTNATGANTTFKVDNKVNLSLVELGNAVTSVVPGSSAQAAAFTLTNNGNSPQGYILGATNSATTPLLAGVSDTGATGFDIASAFTYALETNGTPGYQAGFDTVITSIPSLSSGQSVVVYVLADIPITVTNGQQANINLTAVTTTANTTTPVVESTGADVATQVDIVFADAATVELEFVGADAARNAEATARDAYRVKTATLTVTKTVATVCDPFNGNVNPKSIPGAFVRYTITVANGGSSPATLTTIGDALVVANVNFDNDLIVGATPAACVTGVGSAAEFAAGSGFKVTMGTTTPAPGAPVFTARTGYPQYFTSISSVDGIDFVSPNITATFSSVLNATSGAVASELRAGESVSVTYQVQIK